MTNAGVKVLDTEANVPNFGRAMFDMNQTANVFGFSHLVKNFRMTYDSSKEDAFIVHTNCGQVKFCYNPQTDLGLVPMDWAIKLVLLLCVML